MTKALICWIGFTDLRAPKESEQVGLGPIAQAVQSFEYDEMALVNNYPEQKVSDYIQWLKKRTTAHWPGRTRSPVRPRMATCRELARSFGNGSHVHFLPGIISRHAVRQDGWVRTANRHCNELFRLLYQFGNSVYKFCRTAARPVWMSR